MTNEITLPDGTVAEVDVNTTQLDLGFGVYTVHLHEMRLRTIERWRDKAVFAAIRDAAAGEMAEIENAFWNIFLSRFIDHAYGASLDLLGRIVGEGRDGRDDPSYRVRIRARIKVNQSTGSIPDMLAVLELLDPSAFYIYDAAPATMVIVMASAPTGFATATEIADLAGEASGAGIGVVVAIPSDATAPLVWGDTIGGSVVGSAWGDTIGGSEPTPAWPDTRIL